VHRADEENMGADRQKEAAVVVALDAALDNGGSVTSSAVLCSNED
jgi:hypothetical protein